MTERQIENRIKKLQAIEAQQKELEAQAEALKAEIKVSSGKLFGGAISRLFYGNIAFK